ncbi:MAG: aldehyde dehydrogenase family protein [Actinobacteria bacterium]|nr:aldehyde dehydrogenase family protein [Actinomycetota bacterium]
MTTTNSGLHIKAGHTFADAFERARSAAPDAFGVDRLNNLWAGEWRDEGTPQAATSPVDASAIVGPPMLDPATARLAMDATVAAHDNWRRVPLAERRERVQRALARLDEHRDLLTLLLVWEIGKPWDQAADGVNRTISGVEWYCDEIDGMLTGRRPLPGPVSNIASWNYPLSVLVHAMLVQALAGNAVIAKSPTDGGVNALTLAVALAADEGLPFTLVSGSGSDLSPVLVNSPEIGCVSFVGGRDTGGQIASQLANTNRPHILEQEGLNTWGIWEFSDWDTLADQIRKGFAYGKQRCTAYPRYVVQRSLFDRFLAMYLPVLTDLRFGHPLAVASDDDAPPSLDFGPLINAAKVADLEAKIAATIDHGAVPLYRGDLANGAFIDGQDTSAYLAPMAMYDPPRSSPLHHAEPFGPVDTVIAVDTEADLLAGMNASNGALVSSVACDDPQTAQRLAAQVQAFKVGINKTRSRGDRAEPFGGRGASWRGAFVGGELLVHAVTEGPAAERAFGNFPDYRLEPAT